MFIEKMSDAQCNCVFEALLTTAFNNEIMARFYMNNSRLLRFDDQMVKLQFYDVTGENRGRYKDIAHFSDFSAEVGLGGKKSMNPTQVNRTFRREMFREFGKDYYRAYDNLYRTAITNKYFQALSAHNEILADMVMPEKGENEM
jgi:hypothetical protein